MNKIVFALVLILAMLMFALIVAPHVSGKEAVILCHKPGTPAEHWLTVDDDAVPAHLNHGDWVWDGTWVATCGDETLYPPNVTPTLVPTIGDPLVTQEPTLTPEPLSDSDPVFLPMMLNDCAQGWPWCSVPSNP